MSETLKPCPFCGNEKLDGPHEITHVGDSYLPYWWIECGECPCGMEVDGESPDELVKSWNNRKG